MRIYKACLILALLPLLAGCGGKEPVPAVSVPKPEITAAVTRAPVPALTQAPTPAPTPKEVSLSVYTPTPTPSPVPTPSPTPVPFLGQWVCSFEEETIVLTLQADGVGTIAYAGEEQPFVWSYEEGALTLTGARTVFTAEISSDTLSVATLDGDVVFAGKEQP